MNVGTPETTYLEPGAYRQNQILDGLGQRIAGLCATHWDINAIWLLREDLLGALAFLGDNATGADRRRIDGVTDILNQCIEQTRLPDAAQNEHLQLISDDMHAPAAAQPAPVAAPAVLPAEAESAPSARLETPPKAYWRQWSEDAPAAVAVKPKPAQGPGARDAAPTGMNPMNEPTGNPTATESSPAAAEPNSRHLRIYHLSDYNTLSIELDQMLEKQGYDVELLSSAAELKELLHALPADLILVDAGYEGHADAVNAIVAEHKQAGARKLLAVRISAQPGDPADTLLDAVFNPADGAVAITAKIDRLLKVGKAEQFRVLIVEDDRSQAMFAEGILRTADISTKVLLSSENLLPTIDAFKPDLILMDLHLPNASGIELTELIRKSEQFQNTPIVFLSGEADEDIQMDALEAGGDDFLTKPIRPRRLIAAVQNRIKRHRALQTDAPAPAAGGNGLLHRADMLDLLRKEIGSADRALLFIEMNGFNLLKDRLGLTVLEDLLKQFSALLVEACAPNPVARFGDGSFVTVYQGDCDDGALQAYASKIRERLMARKFDALGKIIEARVQVGVCHFGHGQDTDQLINTAERSARSARSAPSGVSIYKPQSSAEALREERIIELLSETGEDSRLAHVYQPIVAVAGSGEKQFQTLLRLLDDDGKLLAAAEFIPIAEKCNLIIALDRWSVAKAAAVIAQRGRVGDELKLFVSQSNLTLLEPGQTAWLKNLLKAEAIPEGSLVIEINHDDALLNHQSIHDFCQTLVHDGILFCLSRYNPRNDESNLLDSLPISYVKLAPKFTADLGSQPVREQIKALVDRAHRRGVEVIGHSVEDAQSAATLWMSGIDFIQGNLVQSANDHLEFGFDQSVL